MKNEVADALNSMAGSREPRPLPFHSLKLSRAKGSAGDSSAGQWLVAKVCRPSCGQVPPVIWGTFVCSLRARCDQISKQKPVIAVAPLSSGKRIESSASSSTHASKTLLVRYGTGRARHGTFFRTDNRGYKRTLVVSTHLWRSTLWDCANPFKICSLSTRRSVGT